VEPVNIPKPVLFRRDDGVAKNSMPIRAYTCGLDYNFFTWPVLVKPRPSGSSLLVETLLPAPPNHSICLSAATQLPNSGELFPSSSGGKADTSVVAPRRSGSLSGGGSPSEEERKKLVRSIGAKKRAARKWTNKATVRRRCYFPMRADRRRALPRSA
jgi:hypothetical protein